ncbi:hypothetical protein Y1Q_0018638 [Alligator mississippiensis]|uniref:Uncharacterized protein n=1 Tax=Alligator mississippiensis TaxID=8496 RepID=A0A151NRQ4_ALLMI|nr:hypothetical protein Y1Q_0018638 [Alligator mississippiensis]
MKVRNCSDRHCYVRKDSRIPVSGLIFVRGMDSPSSAFSLVTTLIIRILKERNRARERMELHPFRLWP